MKIMNYSASRGNPISSSKNERELRKLGTESHLSARNEGEGKIGSQYLFHFAYSSSLFVKFTILSIQQFIPSQ